MANNFDFSKMIEKVQKSDTFLANKLSLQFAKNVETMLNKRNLKQKDLAKRMNVSPAHISKVLNGNINMTLVTMSKIAKALECSISEPVLYSVDDGEFLTASTSFVAFRANDQRCFTNQFKEVNFQSKQNVVCIAQAG